MKAEVEREFRAGPPRGFLSAPKSKNAGFSGRSSKVLGRVWAGVWENFGRLIIGLKFALHHAVVVAGRISPPALVAVILRGSACRGRLPLSRACGTTDAHEHSRAAAGTVSQRHAIEPHRARLLIQLRRRAELRQLPAGGSNRRTGPRSAQGVPTRLPDCC
jgi:hypothetical protein